MRKFIIKSIIELIKQYIHVQGSFHWIYFLYSSWSASNMYGQKVQQGRKLSWISPNSKFPLGLVFPLSIRIKHTINYTTRKIHLIRTAAIQFGSDQMEQTIKWTTLMSIAPVHGPDKFWIHSCHLIRHWQSLYRICYKKLYRTIDSSGTHDRTWWGIEFRLT